MFNRDNSNLVLGTNNLARLLIDTNGNVGISSSAPTHKLHIQDGDAAFKFSGSAVTSGYTTAFTMDNIGLKIGHDSSSRDIQIKVGAITKGLFNANIALTLSGGLDIPTAMSTNWTTAGWSRGIGMMNGGVIYWPKRASSASGSRGIGVTSDTLMYFARSATDAALDAVTYDMVLSGTNSGGSLGIGTNGPPSKYSRLELGGTDGALLIPRLTNTQKDALTPTAGMMIYNSTSGSFNFYNTTWKIVTLA